MDHISTKKVTWGSQAMNHALSAPTRMDYGLDPNVHSIADLAEFSFFPSHVTFGSEALSTRVTTVFGSPHLQIRQSNVRPIQTPVVRLPKK